MSKLISIVPLGLLVGAACTLQGSLVFQDFFDYGSAEANLGTLSPWTQSTGEVRYVPNRNSSFSHGSYVLGAGNVDTGRVETFGTLQRTSQAPLTASGNLTGEIWVSGLHAMSSVAGSGVYTMFSLGPLNAIGYNNSSSDNSTHFGFVNNGGTLNPVIATGSGNNWGTTRTLGTATLTAETTYLVIAQANTATSTLNLWVFDESATFGTTVASLGTPLVTTSGALLAQVSRIGLGQFNGAAGSHWDALRVSNTAGDAGLQDVLAIPEPSTYAAIFGLLGLAFVAWRRRARR